jgi:hypothetical protein
VHDFTVASRFSDDGFRRNSATRERLLQTDVAAQATPKTTVLLQGVGQKNSGGLPASVQSPDSDGFFSRRQNQYNLHVRQYLGAQTHLWLKYGIRAERVARDDPDALPPPPLPDLPNLGLYHIYQRSDERVAELRLDHRAGPHLFTYGLADLRLNLRLHDQTYRLPADPETGRGSVAPALQDQFPAFLHDFVQYLQDDCRLGGRGSLIAGAQLLQFRDHTIWRRLDWRQSPPGSPPSTQIVSNVRTRERELLPYLGLTYPLDARNLVRILGNRSLLRPASSLLAPSEAFLVGEPISIYFTAGAQNGRAETYELDYEHRLSPRTFSKLFWQSSRAQDFIIQPVQEQQLIPQEVRIPLVRVRIVGLRLERQLNRSLSGFARWSYWTVEDRTTSRRAGMNTAVPNPARGLQVPFEPRWRGLMGLNYVDRTGLKALLLANFLGQRFTDVTSFGSTSFARSGKRPSIGPHLLFDLRIAREPSVRTEYGLTVANLFNTTYQDVLPGFPTRGRTWLLTFARRF